MGSKRKTSVEAFFCFTYLRGIECAVVLLSSFLSYLLNIIFSKKFSTLCFCPQSNSGSYLVVEILVLHYDVINLVGHEVCIRAYNLFRKGLWKEFQFKIRVYLLSTYKAQKVIDEKSYTDPTFYCRARLTDVCFFIRLLDPQLCED